MRQAIDPEPDQQPPQFGAGQVAPDQQHRIAMRSLPAQPRKSPAAPGCVTQFRFNALATAGIQQPAAIREPGDATEPVALAYPTQPPEAHR